MFDYPQLCAVALTPIQLVEIVDGYWCIIERDQSSAHCLPSFLTVLDELCGRHGLLNASIRRSYYERIAAGLPERPRWQHTVVAYMRDSRAFTAFWRRHEDVMFDQLMYGCKMVGDQM